MGSDRSADIHLEKLPNGYWLGRVTIKVPQLYEPIVREGDSFHDADEVLVWARGEILAVVLNV